MRWLYDALIIFYAISLTLFFSDVLQPRRAVNRSAVVLLFVAFLSATGLLFERFEMLHMFPAYTRSDLMILIAWVMLVTTLVLDTFLRIGLVLFFTNVLGFVIVLFAGYQEGTDVVQWAPNQDLLLLHIVLSMLGEVAFGFAFVFAVMHALQEGNLRHKRWNRWFLLLPSLDRLDTWCFVTTAIGFFLLFAGMAVGDLWGELVLHRWIVWSPKPVVSILNWIMYGVYLYLHAKRMVNRGRLHFYQMACFMVTLINLTAISSVSTLHN